jgi:hypothetical protein
MNTIKSIIGLILVLCLFQAALAEKRVKPLPMKDLTDPSSPSYVPYPYPKNRVEIIEDLKYAIKIHCSYNPGAYSEGKIPNIDKILLQVSEEHPNYEIHEIVKVKNRNCLKAHDYDWLIIIRGVNGEIAARVILTASGLFASALDTTDVVKRDEKILPNSPRGLHVFIREQDVLDCLSESTLGKVDKNEIKKMERVVMPSRLGYSLTPTWEIKFKNGKTYYFSQTWDTIYEAVDKKSWKKDKKGHRKDIFSLIPRTSDFLPDSINDEIIVLKKIKKQKDD